MSKNHKHDLGAVLEALDQSDGDIDHPQEILVELQEGFSNDHKRLEKKIYEKEQAKLKLLEKEKVNINSITILTTKSTKKSILWSQRYKLNFNISTKRGEKDKIFFSSIKRFKGLDSDIVILMDVNDSISELDLYTGTSRAKHKLFLLKTS